MRKALFFFLIAAVSSLNAMRPEELETLEEFVHVPEAQKEEQKKTFEQEEAEFAGVAEAQKAAQERQARAEFATRPVMMRMRRTTPEESTAAHFAKIPQLKVDQLMGYIVSAPTIDEAVQNFRELTMHEGAFYKMDQNEELIQALIVQLKLKYKLPLDQIIFKLETPTALDVYIKMYKRSDENAVLKSHVLEGLNYMSEPMRGMFDINERKTLATSFDELTIEIALAKRVLALERVTPQELAGPLSLALHAQNVDQSAITLLLRAGAIPTHEDIKAAFETQDPNLAKSLLTAANTVTAQDLENAVLYLKTGSPDIIQLLVQKGVNAYTAPTALVYAFNRSDADSLNVVETLLGYGIITPPANASKDVLNEQKKLKAYIKSIQSNPEAFAHKTNQDVAAVKNKLGVYNSAIAQEKQARKAVVKRKIRKLFGSQKGS